MLRAVPGFTLVLVLASVVWVVAVAAVYLSQRETIIDAFEHRLVDLRYKIIGPVAAADQVVFVAVDDRTLDTENAGLAGRRLLARLIEELASRNADFLVLDVLLADAGNNDERAALAKALAQIPSVIAAAARFSDTDNTPTIIWPHADFNAASEIGLVNLYADASRIPRYVPLFLAVDGQAVPSMALVAAVHHTGAQARITDDAVTLGSLSVPLDAGGTMPLRLLGPAGTVPRISASDLLDGSAPESLAGKTVVLGFSAAGSGDLFATPFAGSVPGAEVIATAISQLTGGPTLQRNGQTRQWDVAHAVLLSVFCLLIMLRLPLVRAIPVVVGIMALSWAFLTYMFAQGVWLSAALPFVAAAPVLGLAGFHALRRDRTAALLAEQRLASLRRFQSPDLARQLEQDPDYLLTPQEQNLAILFVDLNGFTSLSQKLGAEGTRALLQRFHSLTAEAAEAHQGSVINFMGDGALVVFGLMQPPPGDSIADAALASTQTLERALGQMQVGSDTTGVGCRSGLHCGPVLLSRLGAANHQQVTVSGDAVNLASRLMEVAKAQQASIAATTDFTDHVTERDLLEKTTTTQTTVRGRSGRVDVILWPAQRPA